MVTLKTLLSFLSSFFSLKRERYKEDKRTENEKLFEIVQSLIETQREERQFYREWLTGFQSAPPPAKAATQEDDIIEELEDQARLGNNFAQDLIANPDRLKDYIKTLRDNY